MIILRGQVLDPQGHPVGESTIRFISAPRPMPDIAQVTDADGCFTVGLPIPGRYRIGARSDEWGEADAEVTAEGDKPLFVELRLKKPNPS